MEGGALTCLICIEQHDRGAGVQCSNGHFLCNADIAPYLSENVFPHIHKLKQNNGAITCPSFQCNGTFSTIAVFMLMADRERSRYLSIITMLCESNAQLRTLRNALHDVMVLRCPTCKTPVDPFPDACSAVMCLNCGNYYCNYCFQPFATGNSDEDRAQCHTHVAAHSTAEEAVHRDAFLPAEVVTRGQHHLQCLLLQRCLQLALTSKEFHSPEGKHTAAMALLLLSPDITDMDMDIRVEDIWNAANGIRKMDAAATAVISGDATAPNTVEEASMAPLGADGRAFFGPVMNSGAPQLANALKTNNLAGAKQILQAFRNGMDVNYVDPEYRHPLTSLAVLFGHAEIAITLLQRGADPMRPSSTGRSVVYIAAEKGLLDVVKVALELNDRRLNADSPVTTEANNYRLVHVAARYNHGHILRYLSYSGADINLAENEFGYSPLLLAVVCGHTWASAELLRLGADVTIPARNGRLPLYVAVEKCLLGLIDLLTSKSGVDVNASVTFPPQQGGMTALHLAALLPKSQPTVRFLLSKGADINARDPSGHTPLVTAVVSGSEESVLELLRQGADVSLATAAGRSVLYIAIEKGMIRAVPELVGTHGMDINSRCTSEAIDGLPLTVAVLYKAETILTTVLCLGADVNTRELYTGNTALMTAVCLSNYFAASVLLRSGADPIIRNNEGRTPLFAAVERGIADFIILLAAHEAVDINAPATTEPSRYCAVHVATLMASRNSLSALIYLGADLSVTDSSGRTASDMARDKGDSALLAMLSD